MFEIVYFIVSFIILVYFSIMIFRIIRFILYSQKTFSNTKAFSREIKNTRQHILILGDSSMYGAGIKMSENTIGGLFAKKYPIATIETLAVNGAKVRDLEKQLKNKKYKFYDIILIGIGANDIIQFSNFNSLRTDLITIIKKVHKIGNKIILCHSVNIGNLGFYIFPFDYVFDNRTRKLSRIYAELETKFSNLIYVNFYRKRGNDYYDKITRKKFIAGDGVHPNDYANKYFFDIILNELQKI